VFKGSVKKDGVVSVAFQIVIGVVTVPFDEQLLGDRIEDHQLELSVAPPEDNQAPPPETVCETVPAQPRHVELPLVPGVLGPVQPLFGTVAHLMEAFSCADATGVLVVSGDLN
jgi:hypothetical protein